MQLFTLLTHIATHSKDRNIKGASMLLLKRKNEIHEILQALEKTQ